MSEPTPRRTPFELAALLGRFGVYIARLDQAGIYTTPGQLGPGVAVFDAEVRRCRRALIYWRELHERELAEARATEVQQR